MADMATGRVEYVHNVRVPGMLHGAVVRPNAVGASLMNVNEASVNKMPGFVKVVVKKNVPEADAVEALVELIRENGDWVEVKEVVS